VKNLFYLGKQQEAALTLTAGWDTNLLLHFLKKETNAQITAVTINGGGKQNEIPATASILEHYPKVRHLTATVHYELSSLPEIVWILEGYVFQEGMFLRSELARVLAQEDLHSVFLGACGDQVLYPVPLLKKTSRKNSGGKV
jgi:argininosuccinate synthase